jgi:hypothetical protein
MRRLVTTITLAIFAVAVLAGCGSTASTPNGSTARTPNVVGLSLDKAHQAFEALGIKEFEEKDAFEKRNAVVDSNWAVLGQDPAAGTTLDTDTKITLTIGKIGEDRTTARLPEGSPVLAKIRAEAAAKADAERKAAADKAAAAKEVADKAAADKAADQVPKYGQTVPFTAPRSCCPGEPISLEITVSAPTAFTPKDPADATQAANVYFTVTIKNNGSDEFDPNGLGDEAISGLPSDDPGLGDMAAEGTDGDPIFDLDGGLRLGAGGVPRIGPGKSVSFKTGFSVASADDVTFKMRPYGLGGDTLYFTR